MLIAFTIDSSGWGKDTKERFRKAVALVARKLAESIHKDPYKFKIKEPVDAE